MKDKIAGLFLMVSGVLLGGFMAAIVIGVIIVRWRAPEYTGYEGSPLLALAAIGGVALCVLIYKLGVKISDRLPS